jgi:hypothetical protein
MSKIKAKTHTKPKVWAAEESPNAKAGPKLRKMWKSDKC